MFKTTIRLTLTILFTLCLMSCDQGGTFYDITFHENGGAAVEPVEVAGKDAAGIVLPEPTREHYAFAGWFIDDGTFESEWIPVILEGDLDLYAKWIPTDYLVRFDTRCDLAIQDVVVPLDGQLTLPTPERAGWTFIGWFTGNTLDTIMVGGTYSPTDSVTLKAFWFADTYEITIHWWEDVEPSSFTLSFENIFDDFREPMRPGLEVEGLYLDEARTILFDAMTLPQTTNVLVLYAKYVPTRGVEVAVIAEHPDLSQSAYAQPVWDATAAICEDNGLTYALYLPIEASTSGYLAAITTAIEAGARLVLLPGYLFEPAAGIAQIIFPDITFVVIDGTPVNAQYMPHVLENAVALGFKEEELGFLAGYAAVREGHRNLGFLGGMAVPPVVRYGIGFVAGAYYAADELGVSITFAPEHYAYAGTFGPSLEIRNMADSWYDAGVTVIFTAAGAAIASVIDAADDAGGRKVIQADFDDRDETVVLTAAAKLFSAAVLYAVEGYRLGTLEGGAVRIGAAEGASGLSEDHFRFAVFTAGDLAQIVAYLADASIVVPATETELSAFATSHGLSIPAALRERFLY